ncbi:MAG: glycosyltransferase family 2 protein, partial [SAR324 cluster bacterium]|nr:glycosyltransferase family 2 protein [SAR324 cluster bacterium]
MSTPLISVVMPVYNAAPFLQESISSVLNQTFTDFEFIIIDDGSTDNTEEVILGFDDKRIRFEKNESNLKIVKTLNKGIQLARGKYIARMDADDFCFPERFANQVGFLEENPNIDLCGTWVQTFGELNSLWKYPVENDAIQAYMLFNSAVAHPSVMIRASFFDDLKYEEIPFGEDYLLWIKALPNKQFANFPL